MAEQADLLLIDDLDGRIATRDVGVTVMGSLGVIDAAATSGLADFDELLAALLDTSFRASPKLIDALKRRHTKSK